MDPETLNSRLHHALIRHILDYGHGPDAQEPGRILGLPEAAALFQRHGLGGDTWAIPVSPARF